MSLYGPDAEERLERLIQSVRPEASLVDLEARNVELGGETPVAQDDWLHRRTTADHAIVACSSEL
jgi:hypothetical protein